VSLSNLRRRRSRFSRAASGGPRLNPPGAARFRAFSLRPAGGRGAGRPGARSGGSAPAPRGSASMPNNSAAAPNDLASRRKDLASMPNDLASMPNDLAPAPNDSASMPNDLGARPGGAGGHAARDFGLSGGAGRRRACGGFSASRGPSRTNQAGSRRRSRCPRRGTCNHEGHEEEKRISHGWIRMRTDRGSDAPIRAHPCASVANSAFVFPSCSSCPSWFNSSRA
jgi:hypothetical protein